MVNILDHQQNLEVINQVILHLFKFITIILEDMMSNQMLAAANPDWFASTYGKINQDASSNNAIMANDKPMPEGGAAGQTVAYAFVEITSGINFLLNMPKFQENARVQEQKY